MLPTTKVVITKIALLVINEKQKIISFLAYIFLTLKVVKLCSIQEIRKIRWCFIIYYCYLCQSLISKVSLDIHPRKFKKLVFTTTNKSMENDLSNGS